MFKIKFALVFTLSMLICNSVYAQDIDLSSLSGGGVISHNCILQNVFDATNHWQECLICKQKNHIENHSLSSSNTLGNSCSSKNIKITSCGNCEYITESAVNKKHTSRGIQHDINDITGIPTMRSLCDVCEEQYDDKPDCIYKYTDGTVVDPVNPKLNKTIIAPDGSKYSISWKWEEKRLAQDLYNITYEIKDNKINATVEFTMPDKAFEYFSTSSFTDTNKVQMSIWYNNLTNGSIGTTIRKDLSTKYNATTNTLTASYSLTLRDMDKDYATEGEIQTVVYLYNGSKRCKYSADRIYIATNNEEPTITSTNTDKDTD